MTLLEFILAAGIPSTVMGFIVWYFKRSIELKDEKRREEERRREEEHKEAEKQRVEREKKVEKLMLFIMQTSRATNVLAEATAKAVQRIPGNGRRNKGTSPAPHSLHRKKELRIIYGNKNCFDRNRC